LTDVGKIIDAYRAAIESNRTGVLATIVHVEGSAYRRPSARMLWLEGGDRIGAITGGCLDAELDQQAREVLRSGERKTLTYDLRSPDDILWGSGSGCPGEVQILLEPLEAELPGDLNFIAACREARRSGVVATVFDAPPAGPISVGLRQLLVSSDEPIALSKSPSPTLQSALDDVWNERRTRSIRYQDDAGRVGVLLEYVELAPNLVVFGAGDDARPLVRLAAECGWVVQVQDARPAYASDDRFPAADRVSCVPVSNLDPSMFPVDRATAVVLMTHHFLNDLEILKQLLPTAIPYVATLGPIARAKELRNRLIDDDVFRADDPPTNWYAPAGLDIGSETAEEIALAILAEARAVLSGRLGESLRERRRSLHQVR